MGRSLLFYAVSTAIPHDPSKPICMQWEYERESDDAVDELYAHLHPLEAKEYDGRDWNVWMTEQKALEDEKWKTWSSYDIETSPDWCPRCSMFSTAGLYCGNHSVIKDKFRFSHSYNSKIWDSGWHFYNMRPGTSQSDFCNSFICSKGYSGDY